MPDTIDTALNNIELIHKAVEETYFDDCLFSFIIDPDLPHYALLHPTRLEHFQTFFFNNPVNNVFSKLSFPDVTVLKVRQQPEYTIYSQDGDVIYSTEEENKRKEESALDTVIFKNYSFPFEEDWERMRQRLSEKNLKNKMKEHGMYSILCKAQIGGAECDIHIKAALREWQKEC